MRFPQNLPTARERSTLSVKAFGEKTTSLRWAAVLLGLIGVVIVIRPDANGFSFLSIFAIIGMLGFAARDLASSAAPLSLAISTFRYTRLRFGIGMGVLLFQERLDVSMLLGCLLIVTSGLVVLFSQAKN